MTRSPKKFLRPAAFTLGGALIGLGYYHLTGCTSGMCPITATPLRSMLYMAVLGWLLFQIFQKERDDTCNT